MSGGSFDYAFARMDDFVYRLTNKLDDGDLVWDDPAVTTTLRAIAARVSHAARLAREAEWLYSGDTGEETFLKRVAEIGS